MTLMISSVSAFVIHDIVFKSIKLASSSIYNGLYYLTTSSKVSLDQEHELKRLDLETKTDTLLEIVQEMDTSSMAVQKLISNIVEIINQIKLELQHISELKLEHKKKWFSNWRTLDFSQNIENLLLQNEILNSRINLLKSCHVNQKITHQ